MKQLFTICVVAILMFHTTSTVRAGVINATAIDETPSAPLPNPVPSSYQPRYISGFGNGDSFTVFFEDRDAGGQISYASTSTGPTGFPASVNATNIADTHFCVKDWPINIGGTDYAYRAWGAVGNNPNHHFYVSNDLANWILVSTFQIPSNLPPGVPGGWVYYCFHDVIYINGTYYAWGECNQGHTLICRSTNGDDVWEAFDRVGGLYSGPLQMYESGTPSGSFFDLGANRGYGKIMVRGNDSGFYLAVNTAAKSSLSPAQLEAAFIDPDNWTWHDGTIGLPTLPILEETSEHDLRECWLVPDPGSTEWTIVYDADFGSGDGGKALGYAVLTVPPPPTVVWVDDDYYDGGSNDGHTWSYDAFDNITDAIDAVADAGKIIVNAGNYAGALLDKNVEIKGEDGAVIDDGPLHPAGLIYGFQLLDGSDGATISHLDFTVVDLAIYHYASASDVTVEHCTFTNPIQAITNWGGSGWQISHNDIEDLRTITGGGIGILVGDRSGGIVEGNVISHNTVKGVLHVDPYDGGGYDGSGIVLYADFRSWDGAEELKNNRIVKNKVELVSDTPDVVDVWACELTDSRDDEEEIVIFNNVVGFNDFKKTEKQIALTPDNLDEYNDISRNLGENRGYGLHPSVFGL